ncbi:MAG: MBL fold metallo-hydrolase [Candidatus Omnitrophota bacterium]|nr:MBL fold metallo-hydrolase [Candidatus Omnitrophota bacterium]
MVETKKISRVKKQPENFIKFLGTAGARFVMIKQMRASGGIWISYEGSNVLIDPGPGSLVRCASSKPKLDPGKLDAIILTHRHLDHSNDLNVMIEAMTEGGFKKRGMVFMPSDCLDSDPVILRHVRTLPEKIVVLKEGGEYQAGNIKFATPKRQIHTVETYGLKFTFGKKEVSFITDTRYFEDIDKFYNSEIIIISTVFYEPHLGIDHLSLSDAQEIILKIQPKTAILTHFGMSMLRNKPHDICRRLTKEMGIEILAAYDGMGFLL